VVCAGEGLDSLLNGAATVLLCMVYLHDLHCAYQMGERCHIVA
jgi:hypothetical protein